MRKAHRGKGRRRRASRQRRAALTAFCVALAAIMLGLIGYVVHWYLDLGRIRAESEKYAGLYGGRNVPATEVPSPKPTEAPSPEPTAAPTPEPTEAPSPEPTEAPTSAPTEVPTREPTAAPTPEPTEAPTPAPTEVPTREPTEAPTSEPTEAPTPTPTEAPTREPTAAPTSAPTEAPTRRPADQPNADMPAVVDEPIPTPGEDTLVIALPTAPPIQPAFDALLALNPETVGFLEIDGMLSLPVVQRENDNDFYLDHAFEGAEAQEGTLFLDGMNRLVPEDDCLIVYGHNMKNRTMFGRLSAYGDVSYLRQHPIVHFDTLYENRAYAVFAAFTASMEPGNGRYFNVRNFIFDEDGFDKFVLKLQSRSVYRVPIDVRYGDRLLLLVTCNYTNREGRFILALRQLRPDESEAGLWAQVLEAQAK